jgi:branched-chain amino acid transport system ATP-binding protein
LPFLDVKGLRVKYGNALILDDIGFYMEQGEMVALIGPNGAGKTTFLRGLSKIIPVDGSIYFKGNRIDSLGPVDVVKLGIIHCPEGRHLFPDLSVRMNLELGAYLRNDIKAIDEDIEMVFSMFPMLKTIKSKRASNLSGGMQQMVAIGRALMGRPSLLLLDEPSTGLAPLVRDDIMEKIKEVNKKGVSVILVEQDTHLAFNLGERIYLMEQGKIAMVGTRDDMVNNSYVKQAYLGVS